MGKVDLIIPTHNRTAFLKRILDYYQTDGQDFHFIVADSSSLINKARNKKLISKYSQLKIKYIDKFSEKLPQSYKFGEMITYAKSKYCVFCPDDDFIVPNGIRDCVRFLEKNPDYSAVHGTYIGFYLFKNLLGGSQFWWKFRYSPHSISSPNPLRRLFSHLTDYTLVLWAVRRTDVVKVCYKEFLKAKLDPCLLPYFGELLPDALTVIFGKVKVLPTFYAAREYFSTTFTNYLPSLIDAKNKGIYNREYSKFRNCLVNILSKMGDISKVKTAKIIDSAMERYITFSYQEHIMNKVNHILRYFPKFILRGLRLLHTSYLFSKDKKDRIGLINNPSSKYFNDFNNVRRCVLQHDKTI